MDEEKLRKDLDNILQEPDVSCMDWSVGHWVLQQHKVNLRGQILSLIRQHTEPIREKAKFQTAFANEVEEDEPPEDRVEAVKGILEVACAFGQHSPKEVYLAAKAEAIEDYAIQICQLLKVKFPKRLMRQKHRSVEYEKGYSKGWYRCLQDIKELNEEGDGVRTEVPISRDTD